MLIFRCCNNSLDNIVLGNKGNYTLPFRLLTNPDDAILNGEDRQRSKASAPRMARFEPTWMYLRRLYDLPVLFVAGTLSITSRGAIRSPYVMFLWG
ncbi:hypothetical protein YPS_4576 [Yersinia pestis Pestoides A]|nr:hypothetical protein YPS_4576 [Yersinia pestis Pestoides A]